MAKLPPRETIGQTVCTHKHCDAVATVKKDKAGYLYMVCPECGTVPGHREKFQNALRIGMAAYSASQEKQAEPETETPPIEQQSPKSGGLLGGLSIFS